MSLSYKKSLEHGGYSVDLSIEDTLQILERTQEFKIEHRTGPWRLGPYPVVHIKHEGEWWELCRTDLKDDVCTGWGIPIDVDESTYIERELKNTRKNVRYGARLKRHDDGRLLFAVVDAFSDG